MNILLKNGFVLQHDSKNFTVSKEDLWISGDTIAGIGSPPGDVTPDRVVDADGKLILPGLINTHTHGYMTLLRNAADDLAFDDWLFRNILPMEDRLTAEDAYWGSLLACMEMIRTGTTCFLDMHMFQNQTVRAAVQIGMRAKVSRGLVGGADEIGKTEGGYKSSRIQEAFAEMKENSHELITFCLAPHGVYTCDIEFLKYISHLAEEHHLPLHIHLSESRNEVENCKAQHGMTPPELLEQIGFFKAPVIAAHCVHLTEKDIGILKKHQVSVVTNPISNMKLGNGFALVRELMEAGINVSVGTDGAASNNTLNLFREMSMLSLVQKGIHADACGLSASDTFRMATINAAKALGEPQLGQIALGKKADLSIVNLQTPQLQPVSNLEAALIYSMNGSEVESVMINGSFVLEQNRFTHIDETEVYEHINQIRRRIQRA